MAYKAGFGSHHGDPTERVFILLISLALTGCHQSGEWTDDPQNLTRAWGKSGSKGLRAVHSTYWRSAHFTREEVLYFQLEPTAGLKEAFIQANGLVSVDATSALAAEFCRSRPAWFAPARPSSYAAWGPAASVSHEPSHILLPEDRVSGHLFVYACQL